MPRNAAGYDEDFYASTHEQARLLRKGAFSQIDAANLAEEIEDMGKSNRRELGSRLAALLMHLLKWRFQPSRRSPGWAATIREQRDEIEELLADSRSLRPVVRDMLSAAYARARRKAIAETGLAEPSSRSIVRSRPSRCWRRIFCRKTKRRAAGAVRSATA